MSWTLFSGFCERLLPACSRLRILATSREFLDVRGEHAIQTPPLAVPGDPALAPLSDAVQLFLARAAAGAPWFRPDEADLRTVMQVCRRLDGLPLAIELAAARLRALSLSQLAARLDDQFWLLTGGSRAQVPRQRTLEATVAWSYDLLSEVEQRAFARLAVFPHHFTLDMAEAVVSEPPVSELDVVDIVARLVDKSLVTTVNAPDGLRYQLLEMLRQYGHDRLIECGEADRFRERLFACAMSGVEQLELVMRTPAMDDALQKAAINAVTYRAAMRWAASHKQEGAALRIAAMVPLSHHRGKDELRSSKGSARHTRRDNLTIRQRATPGRLSPMPPSSRATGRHRCRRAPGRSSTSRPQGSRGSPHGRNTSTWPRPGALGSLRSSTVSSARRSATSDASTTTWAWGTRSG